MWQGRAGQGLGHVTGRGHRGGLLARDARHARSGADASYARSRPHGLRALQRHADPCEQLLNRKRLGQVIVGAGIEPSHLVHHGIARGDHNHRHILVLADAPQHFHTVELRQQYVEQNQIVVALQRQVHGGAAVGGVLYLVTLVLQLERHKAGDFLLVLYNQDSCHTCPRLRLLVVVEILLDVVCGVGGVIHKVVDTAGHIAVAVDAVAHAKEQAKQHQPYRGAPGKQGDDGDQDGNVEDDRIAARGDKLGVQAQAEELLRYSHTLSIFLEKSVFSLDFS